MEDPSAKFKALEAHIKKLEMSQRKRRLGKSASPLQRRTDRAPKLPSVRRPKTAPASTKSKKKKARSKADDDSDNIKDLKDDHRTPSQIEEDHILERFSAARRRKEAEKRFETSQAELHARKLQLKKEFSTVCSHEILLKKRLKHWEQALFTLKGQDDIRQSRKNMGVKIRKEQERLEDAQEQINELRTYSKTLQLMERRLWDEQITHVKTLETYYGALDTHKLEVTDTEILARNMHIARLDTESQLLEVNEKTEHRLNEMNRRLAELDFAHKQRQAYTREIENKNREMEQKIKDNEKRQKQEAVTEHLSQIKKLKKMQTLTENLEKHEAAFRKIQMASGLHEAEAIIENYTNRDKILRGVKSKVDVLQTQLTKAQERHDRAKTNLDAEKYEATPGRDLPAKSGEYKSMSVNQRTKALSKEAGKADLENLAVQRKSAQAEMRRVLVENRSIRTLMIKIAQSIKLLHDFLSIGETSSSEYNDEEKKKKQPQSVRSMLSPNVMVSSMQEIETKVVGILNKIIKDEFPDNKSYFSQIENNLNSIAAMKQNNIRIVRDRDAAVRERDKAMAQQLKEDNEMRKYRARMLGGDDDLKDMRKHVKIAKMRARALRSNKSLAELEAETGVSIDDIDMSDEVVDRSTIKQAVESLAIRHARMARRNGTPGDKSVDSPTRKGRSRKTRSPRKSKNAV